VVNLDVTIWVQMVNFLVLIVILNVLLYKPILAAIENRKRRLQEADDEVKRLNKTVEDKVAEYEEKLRLAKVDAMNRKSEILKEAADQAKAIIDAQRAKIPAMMAEFQARVAKEIEEARKVLARQSEKISAEIAQKVLGRSI